ncbi:MAG: esterase [Polyangiaceae bacterium]|nr:esterase [Polyangiaceae bacterium]
MKSRSEGEHVGRRSVLCGAAWMMLPALSGCRCGGGSGPEGGPPGALNSAVSKGIGANVGRWREVFFGASDVYAEDEKALILVPEGAEKLPIVVALHGRGETRSLDIGARGFRDYYGVDRLDDRLRNPPLNADDLLGFTNEKRLGEINRSLEKEAYKGVVLACPYAPDLKDRSFDGAHAYTRFLVEVLLPRVHKEAGEPKAPVGIDGVSMGGRLALWAGFHFPEVFSAVGAMQPALRLDEADRVAELAGRARAKNPKLRLRLISSEKDPFLEAVKAASKAMEERRIEHDLVVVPGPHNYEWNQGPGSAEMLLWQERALRGLSSP